MSAVTHVEEHRTHGAGGFAVLSERRAGIERHLFERSVMAVVKEKVLGLVVGHVDIGIAVAVEIGGRHAHGAPFVFGDPGLLADVDEPAVTVIVEQ